ncbi:sarcosine oxidase subunit delta [Pseudooceanicola algae]|uniref:Sarcosine oxidase subunit delta n=1 Tax=Pseudooceanicola algae TaxID=1537215 RepID=A0A418SFD5_9RHOB|nr:sarcosine oxidase subunit delta [Pseudooceanicola algae]QPM89192.1 Sarcosine oxidase subunit delta [Pseudooceanicola algae]
MRLTCPHCGSRDLREFTFRGAVLARPEAASGDTPAEEWSKDWHGYLHLRDNPAGLSREYWSHEMGCAAFLVVTRDTRTHEVHSVTLAVETPA